MHESKMWYTNYISNYESFNLDDAEARRVPGPRQRALHDYADTWLKHARSETKTRSKSISDLDTLAEAAGECTEQNH